MIKDYVGAFDQVTAAQCRGLSCEIEAKRAGAQTLKSHGITINTRGGFETTRIVFALLGPVVQRPIKLILS